MTYFPERERERSLTTVNFVRGVVALDSTVTSFHTRSGRSTPAVSTATRYTFTFTPPDIAIILSKSVSKKGKGSPYSIAERRVPELIPVLGSQSAGDVSHKPCGRLPLLSTRPAVTPATLKRTATNFAAW